MVDARVLILILLCFIYVKSAAIRGKASLCRDPDTGKLYTVNATWSSTTFCGNYTCKLRRLKNHPKDQIILREFTVTPVNNNIIDLATTKEQPTLNDTKIIEAKIENSTEVPTVKPEVTNSNEDEATAVSKNIQSIIKSAFNQSNYINEEYNNNNIDNIDENDRFLTKKEIESLTEALRTVKKSDLEAIVDIYSLAQEIYNEMDTLTDESHMNNNVHQLKQREPASYFYEPQKGHVDDDDDDTLFNETVIVITKPPTTVSTTASPIDDTTDYPLSQFHRIASYVHKPRPSYVSSTTSTTTLRPCSTAPAKPAQKSIQPSYLLPYPFTYVHHYNGSNPNNIFYNNPWLWDYYKRRNYKSYLNALIAEIPKTVLINRYIDEHSPTESNGIDHVVIKETIPEWKTEPLTSEILEDIRANIAESGYVKPFPLKKKVKLEKVTKVIKMNELDRVKRELNNGTSDDEYETFIETTTCATTTDPGFFRYGNMSQPYPHCCPQLIKSR